MKKEIERKYELKDLPANIKIEKVEKIEQAFIYKDINTLIRIRKVETKVNGKEPLLEYIYTLKTRGDIQYNDNYTVGKKYEIENNITQQDYEKLLQNKISNQINKTRVVVPIKDNLKVEIDIYNDYLEGFLTAEVEFENEEQANKFEKPEWFGEELGYKELSNRKLAGMNKEEFRNKVTEEFIENNKIIIEKLKKLI